MPEVKLETVCWSMTSRDEHCGCFFPQYLMASGYKDYMDQHYPDALHTVVPLVEKNLAVPKAELQEFIDKLNQDLARVRLGEEGFKKEGNDESIKACRYQENALALVILGLQEIIRNNTYPGPDDCCSCHINPPCNFCLRGGSLPESER